MTEGQENTHVLKPVGAKAAAVSGSGSGSCLSLRLAATGGLGREMLEKVPVGGATVRLLSRKVQHKDPSERAQRPTGGNASRGAGKRGARCPCQGFAQGRTWQVTLCSLVPFQGAARQKRSLHACDSLRASLSSLLFLF